MTVLTGLTICSFLARSTVTDVLCLVFQNLAVDKDFHFYAAMHAAALLSFEGRRLNIGIFSVFAIQTIRAVHTVTSV